MFSKLSAAALPGAITRARNLESRAISGTSLQAISPENLWHVANYAYSLRAGTTWPGERNVIEGVELAGDLPGGIHDAAWEKVPASTNCRSVSSSAAIACPRAARFLMRLGVPTPST